MEQHTEGNRTLLKDVSIVIIAIFLNGFALITIAENVSRVAGES